MQALRTYLRELRIRKGVSQDELAEAIGISRQQLMRWETGKTSVIRGDALLRAIGYLNASFEDALYLAQDGMTSDDGYRQATIRINPPHKNDDVERWDYVLSEIAMLRTQINKVIQDITTLKNLNQGDS